MQNGFKTSIKKGINVNEFAILGNGITVNFLKEKL